MTAKHYPLRTCPACNGTIRRAASESWPTYHKKTACSMKCAALVREAKERNKISAAQALGQALMGWRCA